ncbi:hypothetical protein ACM1RC_25295 [Paenibacillus azoreducens]|uniref:hypothetical protein n=1 Tax=Paenibacillus azoreducens TaxID=116718 RepID=UPI0039F4AD9E
MVKSGKFLRLAVFTFLFSVLAASPTFAESSVSESSIAESSVSESSIAASSVSNWHVDLEPSASNYVGQSFRVAVSGSSVTVAVDQYVKDFNGNEDKSKAANVTYFLHNTVSGNEVPFTVDASVGGANGAPAYKTFTNVNAGTYIIRARNNISSRVATGGNVYVSN